jgi:two-component system cell cycle sensor histidine kinase/response regulator CckA
VPTELALLGNFVISAAYVAITVAIVVPVVQAGQLIVNRLATATALIFFSCAVGHAWHALGYWQALMGSAPMAGMSAHTTGLVWPSALWDAFTATVAVYYWTLRRRYGALLGNGGLYLDPEHRRRLEEANAREQLATSRADEHQAMLAAVVEQSDDAIIGTDLDGAVTAWNCGAERMFGYSAAEAAGAPAGTFVLGLSEPERRERMARVAGGERGIRYDARVARKDGDEVDVAVTLSPVFDGSDAVVGTAQIARDVSAAKRAEATQRTAEERAQQVQRMASLGQLAGGIAHDFNNLLGIIVNFTDFAVEQIPAGDAVRDDLAQVRTAAERATGLTRQLLTFTRQDRVRPEVLDVNASIVEVHAMLARTIGEHIHLVAHPAPRPLTVFADAGHLQQILINLAVNARDAMPDGGTLVIEARATELDEDHADLQPSPAAGRYVAIVVSDTGVGMSAEVEARIFEPFYTTKAKGQGTGLGLATVYGIVAAAGGCINVYSEPGVGTTFRVYLPLVDRPDEPHAGPAAPASAPGGRGETILVIEDEPALGRAIARILDANGYRALCADSAAEALDLHTAHGCDLVLTDVVMPDMSGPQVAELLKRRDPGLPVVYMSGYTDGLLDAARILEQGTVVIEKPFTAHLLLTRVQEHLPAAAPQHSRPPAHL